MSKINWGKWNDTLNSQSYLLLVAMISATGLNAPLAAILSAVLLTLFIVFTRPVAKTIFRKRGELRRLNEISGLKDHEIDEYRALSEKNPDVGNAGVYMICMMTSMALFIYNFARLFAYLLEF